MIKNRIQKNYKKLKPWSERANIDCYRLYDRDIPEYPFIIDKYKDYFLMYDRSDDLIDNDPKKKNHFNEAITSIKEIFNTSDDHIIIKYRDKQKGKSQYEKLATTQNRIIVNESQAKFLVNLYDYLDTGLFLDHRPMRQKIFKSSKGKNVLNLFCYTGSVSVFAALSGGIVTSVDMSRTYMEWAEDNFKLNNISLSQHKFITENALEYLRRLSRPNSFDLIFLDPPTFSNSKNMVGDFDVERDQEFLVDSCMKLLTPNGVLYFSNNKRKFKLSTQLETKYKILDITDQTIPIDFHDQKIHKCFEITHKK